MKKSKKWVMTGFIVLVALVIAVAVCKGVLRKNTTGQQEGQEWYIDFAKKSYSGNGCFYTESNYLHYLDAKTGKDVLICNDASCKHDKETCSAYFDATQLIAYEENKKLLLITDYNAKKLCEVYLYQSSVNGQNRKKICMLSDNIQYIECAAVTDRYIAIGYYNQYDKKNYEDLPLQTAGVYVYDMKNKKGRTIFEKELCNARILSIDITKKGEVYYSLLGYDVSEKQALKHSEDWDYLDKHIVESIYRSDFSGDKNTKIQNPDNLLTLQLWQNQYFYNDKGKLYAYDTQKNITKELGDEMTLIPTFKKDEVYFEKYDKKQKKSMIYSYDGSKVDKVGFINDNVILEAVFENTVYIENIDEKQNSKLGYVKSVEDIIK